MSKMTLTRGMLVYSFILLTGCLPRVPSIGEADCATRPRAETGADWGDDWPTLQNADHIWTLSIPDKDQRMEVMIPVRDYPMGGMKSLNRDPHCSPGQIPTAITNNRGVLSGDLEPPCDGTPVSFAYQIAVSMPRWRGYLFAIYLDRMEWNQVYSTLRQHELGHVLNNIRIFHNIERSIEGSSCGDVKAKVHALDQVRRTQDEIYDHCTCHSQCQDNCEMASHLFNGVVVTFKNGHL